MGYATDAILAYGYDLGGPDNTWLVQETDQWGGLAVPWFNDEDELDFVEAAKERLKTAGIAGIELDIHCSHDSASTLIAVSITTAARGNPERIDFEDLTRSRLAADWDEDLANALSVLGLTPLQGAPAWLLASYTD